jgi:hypothetical protein
MSSSPWRALLWGVLWALTGPTAQAGEPSLNWPYYRTAMQAEATRLFLGEPTEIPWARVLNAKVGFTVQSATAEDLSDLNRLMALSTARLWTRIKGPPALPPHNNQPVVRIDLHTCRETWDAPEQNMQGLHTAISTWSTRPTCLLQRFGTADGLTNLSQEHVELSLKMVGGRLGARGRVVGWPGEKETGFRALYTAEGPVLTLLSAQVKVAQGWANVMRSGGGTVLLERPMGVDSRGRVNELTARLVYAKPRKDGSKWLDLGRIPTPPMPKLIVVGPPSGGADTAVSPTVHVQNSGAGPGPTRRAAQVVLYTISAHSKAPAESLSVSQELAPDGRLDHIAVIYTEERDKALAKVLVRSLRLAMPWQAVISKQVDSMPGRVRVQVGW